jgi:tRNA dimethylallyltransferase
VAVDAFTVYRGMDVGTAKPSPADRRRVPHHAVDVLDPGEACSVERFQPVARTAISDILARGRTPVLVGGSGLYFRAVVDPLEFPPTDPEVRAAVAARYEGDARRAHADLAVLDPEAAARVNPDNLRRSVRALEVLELTGRPFSAWRQAWDAYASIYPNLAVIGIDVDRATLAERIATRVEAMLAGGLVDECRRLAARPLSSTARQAIGYAEVLDHLAGRCSLADARERIVARTRRYAARQQRWFAADPRVAWERQADALQALLDSGEAHTTPDEEARSR